MSIEAPARPPKREASRPAAVEPPGLLLSALRGLVMYVLPLVVVAAALYGAKWLIDTAPIAERRDPQKQATPVQAEVFHRTTTTATVQAMGTVMPSRSVVLQPRVSGAVVRISPQLVPGGEFKTDEFMVQIDPVDYELAVSRARAQLAQAEYERKLEQGHQDIAEREWDLLDMEDQASALDRELALRKPHLAKAEAAVIAAQAAVRTAELDLERTTIRAPFNCMVQAENVDVGTQVGLQSQLATLVGTDEYWVQAAVPVDQLHWIVFPQADATAGSKAVIRQQLGTVGRAEWQGKVVRLLADLDPRGRMARVLISVPDPVRVSDDDSAGLPMLIDAYVNVGIMGRPVSDVIALPRLALREGKQAWVMNDRDELEIREVDVVWSNQDVILVRSGVDEGDRVVVSDLSAPVKGMSLRLFDEPAGSSQPALAR